MIASDIHVYSKPLDDRVELLAEWASLEAESDNGFFQSHSWISSWLASIKEMPDVICATHQGKTIGLGLVLVKPERRNFFVWSRVLRMHQTGVAVEDQVWVEYNDFLVHRDNATSVRQSMCDYLLHKYPGWDEFFTGAITGGSSLNRIAGRLKSREVWQSKRYGVNLEKLRRQNQSYQQVLSRNTRYQVNRCRKDYQRQGNLCLQAAVTLEQAMDFFEEMRPLHLARWADNGQSGFSNPVFCHFHQNLIKTAWHKGEVELLRLTVKDKPLAYLYNFVYRRRVYFYMGAKIDEADAHLKPGMLAHVMCIESHLANGEDYYDFMGGDMRYKMSLADESEPMQVLACARLRPQLMLEDIARRTRALIRSVGGPS